MGSPCHISSLLDCLLGCVLTTRCSVADRSSGVIDILCCTILCGLPQIRHCICSTIVLGRCRCCVSGDVMHSLSRQFDWGSSCMLDFISQ
jgi:hypothetical protein